MNTNLPGLILFEIVDFAGLELVPVVETLNKKFQEKLNLNANLEAINSRLRSHGY
jgi:hypothetical protein